MTGGGTVECPERRLDVDDAVAVDWRGRCGVDGESADAVSISVRATQRSYLFDQHHQRSHHRLHRRHHPSVVPLKTGKV